MKLVIVESPAKATTITRFLDDEYTVVASYGHIRDLPGSADEIPAKVKGEPWARLGVNTEDGFTPIYVVTRDSKERIAELKKLVKDADEIILATDEDREGESISWHLLEILKPKVPVKRIAFHEITKKAIQEALDNPREVNLQMVSAQESRRILDRLFGYSLSPVLWKKVRPKLSAGRVQSVAVRLVVEREQERKAYKTSEYWDAEAHLEAQGLEFKAQLTSVGGERLAAGRDFDSITGEMTSDKVLWLQQDEAESLTTKLSASLPWSATQVEQKEATMSPGKPFITSSLQRSASSILGYSPRRTMQVAQKLYEGVNLGGGEREGLITYMRTDSVTLSDIALDQAARVIKGEFGNEYHKRRQFSTKSKLAQEAHEGIRPTDLSRKPEAVASLLTDEELKLYRLIWNRTLASQMSEAKLLKTSVEFEANLDGKAAVLRANGSVVTFPGFLKVADSAQQDTQLPPIKEGEEVGPGKNIALSKLEALKHETRPRARYTEASLIQRMEEEGIGRPSTYAPTISTIQARGYVDVQGKALVPTYLAVATTTMLKQHFAEYVDLQFTARMEDALDDIANGDQDSVAFLSEFYRGKGKFGEGLEPHIESELPKIEFPTIALGDDPDTGEPMVVRIGKIAPYIQRGEGGPENNVSVPVDMTYEELDAEKAAHLFKEKAKGNEPIGVDPETQEKIYTLLGPYGPYVQLGERTEENKKPKRASLPKGTNLSEVSMELALKLLSLPRDLGEHPDDGKVVTTAIGRFGPYVKWEKEFRSLEETDDPYTITFERAMELLRQPKKTRRSTKKVLRTMEKDPSTDTDVEVCEGRYGPYVTNGEANRSVPKEKDPMKITMEEALALLALAPKKKKKKKAAKKKKKATAKKKKTATKKKTGAKAKAKTKAAPKAKKKASGE